MSFYGEYLDGSYVYLFRSEGSNRYKIGVSKDPAKRLRQLQTGSPDALELVEMRDVFGNPMKAERALHEHFATYRVNGEWFDFGPENERATIREHFLVQLDLHCTWGDEMHKRAMDELESEAAEALQYFGFLSEQEDQVDPDAEIAARLAAETLEMFGHIPGVKARIEAALRGEAAA